MIACVFKTSVLKKNRKEYLKLEWSSAAIHSNHIIFHIQIHEEIHYFLKFPSWHIVRGHCFLHSFFYIRVCNITIFLSSYLIKIFQGLSGCFGALWPWTRTYLSARGIIWVGWKECLQWECQQLGCWLSFPAMRQDQGHVVQEQHRRHLRELRSQSTSPLTPGEGICWVSASFAESRRAGIPTTPGGSKGCAKYMQRPWNQMQ